MSFKKIFHSSNLLAFIFIIFCLINFKNVFADDSKTTSPIGLWQTTDDVTQKKRSIIKIFSDKKGALEGRIMHINLFEGEKPGDLCTLCTGKNHNQPILGMTLLVDMRKNPSVDNEWFGGTITDPKNGKSYDCKITLSPDGNQLTVRGYLGIPLLGRSQVWDRLPDNTLQHYPKKDVADVAQDNDE